jgi:hypothetical protein
MADPSCASLYYGRSEQNLFFERAIQSDFLVCWGCFAYGAKDTALGGLGIFLCMMRCIEGKTGFMACVVHWCRSSGYRVPEMAWKILFECFFLELGELRGRY